MNISSTEILIVLIVALIVLGPQRLPGAMKQAGKAYRDFKKMSTSVQREINQVVNDTTSMVTDTAETFTGKSPSSTQSASTPANAAYRPADEIDDGAPPKPSPAASANVTPPADEIDDSAT